MLDLATDFTQPPPGYELVGTEPRPLTSRIPSKTSSISSFGSSDRLSIAGSTNSTLDSDSLGAGPAEHEGEALPSYTSAYQKRDILQMKPELVSPFCRASRRNWRTVEIEVNNTMLSIRQTAFYGTVSRIDTYSLQFAEVGLASDYCKRQHVFRLRVESKQFVFSCSNRQQMLAWMVGLQMAISLALPLELRQLPEEVKRRRNLQRERERRRLRESRQRQRQREIEETMAQEDGALPARDFGAHSREGAHNDSPNLSINKSPDGEREQHGEQDGLQPAERSRTRPRDVERRKWHPHRHQSRFSEKDFPHLTVDTTWEGKSILYEGRWALVQNRQIIIVVTTAAMAS